MEFKKLKYAQLIILFIALSLCLITSVIFDFEGLYGQDSFEYLFYGLDINDGNRSYFEWPINFPLIAYILNLLIPIKPFSFQLLSILSYSLSGLFLFKWLKREYGKADFVLLIYVSLFYLLSPYVLRSGISIMSDSLCVLFIILTFYFDSFRESKRKYLVFLFGGLAIGTRYASIVVVAVPLFYSFIKLLKQRNIGTLVLCIFFSTLGILPTLLLKSSPATGFSNNILIENWSVVNFFTTTYSLSEQHLYSFSIPNLIFYSFNLFHPRFFFLGIALIVVLIFSFKREELRIIPGKHSMSILLYILFVSGIPFQNSRFILLVFPIFLFVIFPFINAFVEKLKVSHLNFLSIVFILIQVFLTTKAMQPLIERVRLEKLTAESVESFSPTVTDVYTSGLNGPLRYYCEKKNINPLDKDHFDLPSQKYLLVIDSNYIANNRKGSTLYKNVYEIFKESKLLKSKKVENWTIYELE